MQRESGPTDSLVRRAAEGDEAALGELLDRHRAYLKVIARRMLDSRLARRLDTSDVVQQTLLSAYRKFPEFRGETAGDFLAWLRVLHERNVVDTMRAHGAERRNVAREAAADGSGNDPASDARLQQSATSPSQRLLADERAVELARALDRIPEDQQEAVRLRYLEGWSVARIADHLERSRQAAAGLLKRGLRALRDELQND